MVISNYFEEGKPLVPNGLHRWDVASEAVPVFHFRQAEGELSAELLEAPQLVPPGHGIMVPSHGMARP